MSGVNKIQPKGIFSEEYHAAINKRNANPNNICIFCGRNITKGRGYNIYLTGLSEALPADNLTIEEYGRTDDLGYYPVGPECGKKLPASHLFSRK